jgi:DNA-binding FrmR family transcriptional regulator
MDRDYVLTQLAALRALVDALAAHVLAAEAAAAPGACEHPEEARQDCSTMQGPRTFFCRVCRQTVEVGG